MTNEYIYVQGWNALSEVHEKVTRKRDINDTDTDRDSDAESDRLILLSVKSPRKSVKRGRTPALTATPMQSQSNEFVEAT